MKQNNCRQKDWSLLTRVNSSKQHLKKCPVSNAKSVLRNRCKWMKRYTVYSLSFSYLNITSLMWTILCLLWNQVSHIPRPCILSRPTMLSFGLSDWLLTEVNFPHHPEKMTLREEAQLYFQHIRTVFCPYNSKWARICGEWEQAEPGRKTIIKSRAEGKNDVCVSEAAWSLGVRITIWFLFRE